MTTPFPDALIVLTGGAGHRLGGLDKASIEWGGRTLLDSAIASGRGRPVVIAGRHRSAQGGVISVLEDPPGGGPAAGLAAAARALRDSVARSDIDALSGDDAVLHGHARADGAATRSRVDEDSLIAVMAVDQPGVTGDTWFRLAAAARGPQCDGVALVADGRVQYAVATVRMAPLMRLVDSRSSWHGAPLRSLIGPLVTATVPALGAEADDLDTPEALARWRQRSRGTHAVPPWSGNGDPHAKESS